MYNSYMSRRRTLLLLLISSCFLFSFVLWNWLIIDLPSLDTLTHNLVVPSTKILARDGRLLYEIADPAGAHHTTIPLNDIPLALQRATIATEDASFYTHPGVDVIGIVRALWINLAGGEVLAGGSTLTQQVARNVLLDPQERAERTLTRKLRESILAWRLSQAYAKDEILALYLNQTYYGHLAYGVEAAAQTYFGKSARDLDLAESALLAGLPQAPSLYDPLLYPEAAQTRQAVVLELMVRQGDITATEAQLAQAETLQFNPVPFPIEAPHFVFYVWSRLEQQYGPEVLLSGLTITTTLDLDLTRAAQNIVRRNLLAIAEDESGPAHHATNAALVALDPHTGQILVMLGSPDYFDSTIFGALNLATAPRQPGSAIKPITYAAAFSPELCQASNSPITNELRTGGLETCPWTPATMLLDIPTAFITQEGFSYAPQNYDRAFHGPASARQALAASLNVPAVIALDHVGLSNMIRLAGRMGLTTLSDADRFGLALTLGGGEVRLLDLTAAYGVLANGGQRIDPHPVLTITDAHGRVVEQRTATPGEQVLDERVAYLITDILADNEARASTFGFNSVLNIGRPAAVKTGTTSDYHDNWTVGYTPELVAGVWVGNADNSPMVNLSGVAGAGPIWHDFMRQALAGKPESVFTEPPGLVQVEVCLPSGLLPTPLCPRTQTEIFLDGTAPTRPDNLYQAFNIDSRTGQLAEANTPAQFIIPRVFLVLPPEAQDWARANGLPVPSRVASSITNYQLQITSPDPNTVFQISPRLPRANQKIPFRANAPEQVMAVTFVLDGVAVGTVTDAPLEWWWALEAGAHTLQAWAVLESGERVASAVISFTVNP